MTGLDVSQTGFGVYRLGTLKVNFNIRLLFWTPLDLQLMSVSLVTTEGSLQTITGSSVLSLQMVVETFLACNSLPSLTHPCHQTTF